MKKILLAINTTQVNIKAIDFACFVAAMTQAELTGIFLQNSALVLQAHHDIVDSYFNEVADKSLSFHQSIRMDLDQSMHLFTQACNKKGIRSNILFTSEKDKNLIKETITQTRYADLLIVDPETSFVKNAVSAPSHFIKEVLAQAECPVLIAPGLFEKVDEIVCCYDGNASSVFAIKQFTYLFPQLRHKNLTVLKVNMNHEQSEKNIKLYNWLNYYYPKVSFQALEGMPDDELFKYLVAKRNIWVVMGAYSRSALSQFFKHSSANIFIRSIDLPLFITHL